MKNIKELRAKIDELSESTDDNEMRKLTTLVRSGLFDANKLTLLKRALNKDNLKMTRAEKDTLINLLDKVLDVITGNQQIYQKVKQTVSEEIDLQEDYEFSMARSQLKTIIRDAQALLDQIQGEGEMESWMQSKITLASDYIGAVADNVVSGESEIKKIKEEYEEYTIEEAAKLGLEPDNQQLPVMLILKRKAIRVFPDGQKVGLYYSDRLNKYVTVPFTYGGSGLNEAADNFVGTDSRGYIYGKPDPSKATVGRDPISGKWTKKQPLAAQSQKQEPEQPNAATVQMATKAVKQKTKQVPIKTKKGKTKYTTLAQMGQRDKMASRAKSQTALRNTLKSNVVKDFGQAYKATGGNIPGAAGIALGSAIRRAAFNAAYGLRSMKRSANPGAGPIKEAFERNLGLVKEQAALDLYSPASRPLDMPKTFSPYQYNQFVDPTKLGGMKVTGPNAAVGGAGLPAALAGLGWAGAAMYQSGRANYDATQAVKRVMRQQLGKNVQDVKGFSVKPDVTPPQPLAKPIKPVEIPNPPAYVEPAAQPAARPAAQPLARPFQKTQAQTYADPRSDAEIKAQTDAEKAPNYTNKQEKDREDKGKRSAGLPKLPFVGPADLRAGMGTHSSLAATSGIDPFKTNAVNLGGQGVYGYGSPAAKLGAMNRAAMKAMVREKKEDTIKVLRGIADQNTPSSEIRIGEEYITINNSTAKKLLQIHESLNKINKIKFERMLEESVDSFTRAIDFANKR